MKIEEILKKQGEIYKDLPSNEIIKKCNETIEKPKLVPYKEFLISEQEYKAIKELEKLLGREPNIGNLGYHFDIEIRDHKVINLHIRGLNLTEIPKQINNLPNLEILYLPLNGITEIKNLDKLVNLQILSLYGNEIKKIKNLDDLINLEILFLSWNRISEIKNLDNLINLKELGLKLNPILKKENKKEIEKLKKRKIKIEL